MFYKTDQIAGFDEPIWQAILSEDKCQQDHVELIASENYTSARMMAAIFQQRSYNVVSGGTDNHLFLLNLIDKGITGKDADAALGRANITVNKNSVPNDPQSPFVTSGLRIGTPAVTSRGFGVEDVCELTHWICDVLDDIHNEATINTVRDKVLALCDASPVYS